MRVRTRLIVCERQQMHNLVFAEVFLNDVDAATFFIVDVLIKVISCANHNFMH